MNHDAARLAVALATTVAIALASGLAAPAPARADACDHIPSIPGLPNPVKGACKVTKKIGKTIGHAIGHPLKTLKHIVTAPIRAVGDTVMKGLTSWVASGASWLVQEAGKLIDETTKPRLGSPWFGTQYRTMAGLAAVFALPLLLLSVLQGVLRRDGNLIVRAAFVQLPAAFILTAAAVAVVGMFLQLTDDLCGQVTNTVGANADQFFKDTGDAIGKLSDAGGGVVPLFAVFLGGLVAAIGAFFVWVELVLRSAAVYVAVLFLPFTFVAMIWPSAARWCRRLVELLFAIVFSKFVIVAIMALAAAGLGQSRGGDAFQGVIAGTALMLLAAFSPLALLRLIPLAESAAHASRHSGAGSQTLGPIAGPAAVMRRVTDLNWGHTGGALQAAPTPAIAGASSTGGASRGGSARPSTATGNASHGGSPAASSSLKYAAVGGTTAASRPVPGAAGTSQPTPSVAERPLAAPAAKRAPAQPPSSTESRERREPERHRPRLRSRPEDDRGR